MHTRGVPINSCLGMEIDVGLRGILVDVAKKVRFILYFWFESALFSAAFYFYPRRVLLLAAFLFTIKYIAVASFPCRVFCLVCFSPMVQQLILCTRLKRVLSTRATVTLIDSKNKTKKSFCCSCARKGILYGPTIVGGASSVCD